MIPSRGGPIQHASIRNQYNTLFRNRNRNLQSFSSCAHHDFDRTQNSNQHVPVDPDKRYFTFRVEFQNETFCIPQALDPLHRVNRHAAPAAATAAPAAAQKDDGTGYNRTSLVCQGMKSMVATTLGQVVERTRAYERSDRLKPEPGVESSQGMRDSGSGHRVAILAWMMGTDDHLQLR